jgi:hypothetical protein
MTHQQEDLPERLERQTKEKLLKAKSGMLNLGGGLFSGFRVLSPQKDISSADLRNIKELLEVCMRIDLLYACLAAVICTTDLVTDSVHEWQHTGDRCVHCEI